jgi:hypothetical protein
MSRSESDKIAMTPLTVKLGEKEYKIKLLRINAQREWRKLLMEQFGDILSNFSVDMKTADMNIFRGGLIASLIRCPEKVADLLFAYAPDLPKDEILNNSTEEQLVAAFGEVVGVAFPFLGPLNMMTEILKSEATASPRVGSTRLQ